MRLPNFIRKHQAPTSNAPESIPDSTPASKQADSAERLPHDRALNQELGFAAETAITQRDRQEDRLTRALLYGNEAFESLSGQAFQFQRERAQQDKTNFTSGKAYVYLEDDSTSETS